MPRWSRLIVILGAIVFYLYLSRPAEPVNDLTIDGNAAYLALGRAGLAIVDVSNPEAPLQLSIFDTPGDAKAVAVSGRYAYLADGDQGLWLVDISQLSSPQEVGVYRDARQVLDVQVVNDRVYLAAGRDGLKILNVEINDHHARFVEIGGYNPGPGIQKVTVVGNIAYLLASDRTLRVFRVSRPTQVEELAVINLEFDASTLQVEGQRLYLAAGRNGVLIFDISNPADPTPLRQITTADVIKDIFITGEDFAYLAAGQGGLRVFDISALEQMSEVGSYSLPIDANRVVVSDGKVYLADRDMGLYIIDPVLQMGLKSIASDEKRRGNAEDIVVDDRYAYLASSGQGLRVIDLTDPQAPEAVAEYDTEGQASGVSLAGDFIYLADGTNGFRVLFLTEGERGTIEVHERASIPTQGSATDCEIVDQLLFLADGPGGLGIYNLSDPSSPQEVGESAL